LPVSVATTQVIASVWQLATLLQETGRSLLKFFRDGRNGNQGCVFQRAL